MFQFFKFQMADLLHSFAKNAVFAVPVAFKLCVFTVVYLQEELVWSEPCLDPDLALAQSVDADR